MIQTDFCLNHADFSLDVRLELPSRGVTALFGPSGSGKSSFLRCLAGLSRPQRGKLSVNGVAWQDSERNFFLPPHRRPVGMVFQDAALFPHLTVEQNLAFATRRRKEAVDDLQSRQQLIELLGIGHLSNRRPDTLSGGEKQRVAIARALFSSPEILLLDEPLAALDDKRKAELLPYLDKLQRQLEIPVVYVSHSPQEVARLADHLVLLNNGSVAATGPVDELLPDILPDAGLPYVHEEDAFALLNGEVCEHAQEDFLSRITVGNHSLWVRQVERPAGSKIRLRVLARDVSITLHECHDSSILNILPAQVDNVIHTQEGVALVKLKLTGRDADNASLVARITLRSSRYLNLQPGRLVFAQIKAVAPLE
jgi:molybdate transport system ATP-binding protein